MITDLDSAVRGLDPHSGFKEEVLSLLKKHYKPAEYSKSKGDVRFIENHRMKLWSDVVITLIANESPFCSEVMANRADNVLAEFDKRFNNK